ncbi:hypothetical protein HJG60_008626 [Phyllostomus discolor]|uniref:GST N-terminal domain-containing protein n=1 Tax=Phyllostomus discolor TaxID=89673 RepID=A0A834DI57_9CHIR|nr:hypothetical protein HJG60_008626 [Phyllostomus discolor]
MAAGTLYTYPENSRALNALTAPQYSRTQIHVLSTPPYFHFGQTNHAPEFLHKFPASKIPAFEADNGFCVLKNNAIAYYYCFLEELTQTLITGMFQQLAKLRKDAFGSVVLFGTNSSSSILEFGSSEARSLPFL